MGGACGTYGGREMRGGLRWGNLNGRNNLEDLDLDGRIILKWVLKKEVGRTRLD
jgi:hypothetical protein